MGIKIAKNLTWRKLDGEIILLDLTKGDYFALRGSAIDTWELLLQTKNKDKIIKGVASKYGIDTSKCRKDVEAFLDSLRKKKFIEFV